MEVKIHVDGKEIARAASRYIREQEERDRMKRRLARVLNSDLETDEEILVELRYEEDEKTSSKKRRIGRVKTTFYANILDKEGIAWMKLRSQSEPPREQCCTAWKNWMNT